MLSNLNEEIATANHQPIHPERKTHYVVSGNRTRVCQPLHHHDNPAGNRATNEVIGYLNNTAISEVTNNLTDRSAANRAVAMVQRSAHPTSDQRDAGSIPTHGAIRPPFKMDQSAVRCRHFHTQITYIY